MAARKAGHRGPVQAAGSCLYFTGLPQPGLKPRPRGTQGNALSAFTVIGHGDPSTHGPGAPDSCSGCQGFCCSARPRDSSSDRCSSCHHGPRDERLSMSLSEQHSNAGFQRKLTRGRLRASGGERCVVLSGFFRRTLSCLCGVRFVGRDSHTETPGLEAGHDCSQSAGGSRSSTCGMRFTSRLLWMFQPVTSSSGSGAEPGDC